MDLRRIPFLTRAVTRSPVGRVIAIALVCVLVFGVAFVWLAPRGGSNTLPSPTLFDAAAVSGAPSDSPPATPSGATPSADPTATGTSDVAPATPVPAGVTPTPAPVATPTAGRTPTPTPGRSSTPAPTATPTPTPTHTPTPRPTAAPTPPPLGSCPIFPSSNVWNKDISSLPVSSNSRTLISAIGLSSGLHPDFSATGYGIPYNVVGASTAHVSVRFDYADESDRGPYPIPANPKMEGGSDRHLLMIDTAECKLYELYAAQKTSSGWTAGSGAIWSLRSNKLRPAGWTSADAAGLPIFPGLVRYDEVARGAIYHALRFTAPRTCAGYIYPATHQAGSGSCSSRPPMGLRVRLKASVNISGYGTQARVLLQALKRYGMILADNGSPWYVTGAPDTRWNDDVLHALGNIKGSDFEVVDTSHLRNP